jgi:FixJ family two-component response regulator
MRRGFWFYGTLIAAAMMASLLAWQYHANGEGKPIVNASSPTGVPWFTAAAKEQAHDPLQGPLQEKTLAEQVGELMATHDPANAYRAYRLVSDCADFNRDHDRLTYDEAEIKNWKPGSLPGYRGMTDAEKQHDTKFCGEMTERERQSRLDYLGIAAKAGVPGAAVAFANEGPFGDRTALKTRPDDPLVQEWKTTASAQLTHAAETGTDKGVLMYLASENYNDSDLTEQNRLLGYRYSMAAGMIDVDKFGADHPLAKLFEVRREVYAAMVKDFGSDQRAAELAAAQRIVDNAREQRKRLGARR